MEESQKTITIIIKSSPFKGSFCEEALRSCVGLHTTVEKNNINIVLIADGIWYALKDMKQFVKYAISIASLDLPIYVEKESMEVLSVKSENLADGFKISSRKEISAILQQSDVVIAY